MFRKESQAVPMITETEQKGVYLEEVIENSPKLQRKLDEMHADAKALVAEMKERGMDEEIIEAVISMSDSGYDLIAVLVQDIFLNPKAADTHWKIEKVNQYGTRVMIRQMEILLKHQEVLSQEPDEEFSDDSSR